MEDNDFNIFRMYLKDISRREFDSLSKKEEAELVRKYQEEGDESARENLINRMQRFVSSIAMKFTQDGLRYEDFVQEGNIGLMNAIENYDRTFSASFPTYAAYKIKSAIAEAQRRENKKGFRNIGRKNYPEINSLESMAEYKFDIPVQEDVRKKVFQEQVEEIVSRTIERVLDEEDKNIIKSVLKSRTLIKIGEDYGMGKNQINYRWQGIKLVLADSSEIIELVESLD